MQTVLTWLAAAVFLVLWCAVIVAVIALPIWGLWNWLMPVIFGLPAINYWQSCGLLLLSVLLVRGSSATAKRKEED